MTIGDLRRRLLTQQNKLVSPLYVFDNSLGSKCQCVDVSGGWQKIGSNTTTLTNGSKILINNYSIYSPVSGLGTYTYSTVNSINLKGYSKLCFEYSWYDNQNQTTAANGSVRFIVTKDISNSTDNDYRSALTSPYTTLRTNSLSTEKRIACLDLSQIDTDIPRKIAVSHISTSGWWRYLYVYKIWLEK